MEEITRKDQIVVESDTWKCPVKMEKINRIRFLGEDGKECCYTLDQLKHQITVAEFWEGKPVFKETSEQAITRAINTLMENGVYHVEMPGDGQMYARQEVEQLRKTIEALKFTIDTLCKAIDTQRETIQQKDKELTDLNAEIDRIAKESRHPGRYCCHVPCNKEAKYAVYFGAGHEDYTDVCADHLAETIRDVEEYTVYPVQGPSEGGEGKEPELFICPDAEKCNANYCLARTPHKWESGCKDQCFGGHRSGPCVPVKDPEPPTHFVPPAPQEEVAVAEHIPVLYVKIINPSGDDVKEAGEVLKHMRWNFEIVRTNLRDCPTGKKEEK